MARLEDILPEIRKGRKARCNYWISAESKIPGNIFVSAADILADDWEIIPEPTRVADYLVEIADPTPLYHLPFTHWLKQTHPIGKQPEGSVMVPGSEREVSG